MEQMELNIESALKPDGAQELFDMTKRQFAGLFKMMEVTEEEIEQAMKKFPERAGYIWNSFAMFGEDAALFSQYNIELWRHHCRELLDRVGDLPSRKEDRELGTLAEVMIGLCEASLVQPLTNDATIAYYTAFKQVFGDDVANKYWEKADVQLYPSYPNAHLEALEWARKKASKPRNYPSEPKLPDE